MKRIGLTGGVGMGKSAAAQLLTQRGVLVVDSDQLARQLVEPGQPALAEIAAAFGADILDEQGRLRRSDLGHRVFRSPSDRAQLEQILHPRIRAAWRDQFQAWDNAGRPVAVVDIPLLFETGAETELDRTVCVACSAATQQARLALRGWSAEEMAGRLAAQWPTERKMARADYVLWNESGLDVLCAQWARVFAAEGLNFHAGMGAFVQAKE